MSADDVDLAPLVAVLIRRLGAFTVPGRPSVGIWNHEIRATDQIRVTTDGEIMSLLIVSAPPLDDDADLIDVEAVQATRDLAQLARPCNDEHRTDRPFVQTWADDRL